VRRLFFGLGCLLGIGSPTRIREILTRHALLIWLNGSRGRVRMRIVSAVTYRGFFLFRRVVTWLIWHFMLLF
jgi:hypothetical protein